MNVSVQPDRKTVYFELLGAVAGVSIGLRGLGPNALEDAHASVRQTMSDREELSLALDRNGLLPEGGATAWRSLPDTDLEAYLEAMLGISQWLAAVELGELALSEWTGLQDAEGQAQQSGQHRHQGRARPLSGRA